MLIYSGVLLLCIPLFAKVSEERAPLSDANRSLLSRLHDFPPKKSWLDKCLLLGKSFGAGLVTSLAGLYSYNNLFHDRTHVAKEARTFEQFSSICTAGAALACATKLASYSLKCAQEALDE